MPESGKTAEMPQETAPVRGLPGHKAPPKGTRLLKRWNDKPQVENTVSAHLPDGGPVSRIYSKLLYLKGKANNPPEKKEKDLNVHTRKQKIQVVNEPAG